MLVTSGSQQALTLAATVLIEPGDRVLVEEPSYLAALQAFALAGALVVPVACDDDGLDPDAVAAAAAAHDARLLYTIPTFHNPTGRTLPLERRRALAAVAERHGLWLLEDDPYGELRYRGEPLPSLATLPGAEDRTLALSTLSKVAAPGLRIGWVRTPESCAPRWWSPSRPPTCTRRRSTRRPRRAGWRPSISTPHLARAAHRVRPPPRRAARRTGRRAARRARRTTAPTAACSCGRGCPTAGTPRRCCARALERDVAFVPGYPFFAGAPDRATLRVLLHDPPPGRDRRRTGAAARWLGTSLAP